MMSVLGKCHRIACATLLSAHRRPDSRGHTEEDVGHVSDSNDEDEYRNLAVNRLRPSELHWALNHDAVHGIAYAFRNPVAVAESVDDQQDDRKTYLIRVKRDDLARALGQINDWIVKIPVRPGCRPTASSGRCRGRGSANAKWVTRNAANRVLAGGPIGTGYAAAAPELP